MGSEWFAVSAFAPGRAALCPLLWLKFCPAELRFGGMEWGFVSRNGKPHVLPEGDTHPEEQEA